ncbi:prolyl 3-hydroxylase sudestada1 isoform X2 [Manduca sexta]|uniref:prolyl 3-hydroxylase sudestada1 isoform X2 n=1 Tax=Manduca sexta TaxID=7130 RepID=UPI0011842DBE|nr:prolyl 3-hydroxylase sudestada1 isoform X2 [Manduca sexta]
MSSPGREIEEPSSSNDVVDSTVRDEGVKSAASEGVRPPAKRRLSSTVIEISDTESDDSDVCAVNSYQATADEVKRIRADYSSSSSSSDYSSDSESMWEDDSVLLEDEKPNRQAVRAQLNPRANRMDDPKLNSKIKTPEIIERISTHWNELKDHSGDEVTLTCSPFRVCLLHNFLDNPEIINNIVDDMNTLDWSRKKMDLYEFHQTADLASLTWQRSIRGIYELLKTDVMSWVSQVTGLELTSVSASCSLYGPGDHLLVHDDLLGDRRVAFIFYLAPWRPTAASYQRVENGASGDHDVIQVDGEECGWSPHMGGALELLAMDDDSRPTDVVHKIYPRNNMLAFFKVGTDSHHQVGEVVSLELPRLSINGWFHGPAPEPEPCARVVTPPPPTLAQRPHSEPVLMNQWVDNTYMSPRSRAQVQAQMERESEVCLRSLLLPDKYQALLDALKQPDIPWERCGPANQRRYSRVPFDWVESLDKEHPIRSLLKLVSSAVFFRLLVDCTDLTLTGYEKLELQRWSAGDFSLLPPREQYQSARLEAVMYLGVGTRPLCGGSTSYVAPEEGSSSGEHEGALVTLPPIDNALNLVYCDSGAAAFTKYLSKMTMQPDDCFYILTCTYTE